MDISLTVRTLPMAEQFDGECCTDMVKMKEWQESHEKRHVTIDEILDRLMNRLPLWATMGYTAAGAIIGSLITIVAILLSNR